jgi:cyclic pyranopterin phosphate synthase
LKKQLSHIDTSGQANMVDVSQKSATERRATAIARVVFPKTVFETLAEKDFLGPKGSILQTAIIAGIQGAKKTSELIPLCHPLRLSKIHIEINPIENTLEIVCMVKCNERTGVEMEALTGASISALTIYDMCKALSHDINITNIQLQQKTGGKHDFHR